ncbi:transcriptional regulator, partial [Staphylococcus aureus]|nr:transcriptional regulator [Staphylococcus aureus]MDT4069413.1 transcriptional regulator [Staphylococcus aureus]
MFTYFKSAFKNAKPQLLITLIYALIAFAVIAVVYLLA